MFNYRLLIFFVMLLSSCFIAWAQDYEADMQSFLLNQQQIKSARFSGSGVMNVKSVSSDEGDAIINSVNTTVDFISQGTESLRIQMSFEGGSFILLQRDGKKYQKNTETGSVSTSSITASCDMYQSYFLLNLTFNENKVPIESALVTEDGNTFHKYTIVYQQPVSFDCGNSGSFEIDRCILWFSSNGLLVKKEEYSASELKRLITIKYSQIDGIYVNSFLSTIEYADSMLLESHINYTDIQINIDLNDELFQL